MAQDFEIVKINTLPQASETEITGGELLVVAGGFAKRAPASRMKGGKGDKGDSYFIHIRWGSSSTPTLLLTTPSDYMGVYVGLSEIAPTVYSSYQWYKIKGEAGVKGDNGTSYYTHIRWGVSANPTTLLTLPNEYIGIYTGTSSVAPPTYNSYQWYKYKGEKGDTGQGFIVKGYYPSLPSLTYYVTSPSAGDAYGVGASDPYDIYIFDGISNSWVNNGKLQGAKGDEGKSAYQLWLSAGNTGAEADFLNSLEGKDGKDGFDGLSAYDIWLSLGNTGTENDFLNWLKGSSGSSSYVHIRWGASATPSVLLTTPDEYIGIYSGTSPTAPTSYTSYAWYQWKGNTGSTGAAGSIPVYNKSATLSSWPVSGSNRASTVSDANVTANSVVVFAPALTSQDVAVAAELFPYASTATGQITFYAKNQPTAAIVMYYSIIG